VVSVDIEKIKESFKPVPVASAISKAIDTVLPYATRQNIEIVTSVEEPSSLVYGDEGTLAEALVNIIGNAINYSPVGSQVVIKAKQKGDTVAISVADTGAGISEEDLPFIFDGFYSSNPPEGVERGCGLGLAISRRIVEAHNGSISVESQLGKGSTFVLSLPALERDGDAQPPLDTDALADSRKGDVG
jgi:signal transduction histidine kinase